MKHLKFLFLLFLFVPFSWAQENTQQTIIKAAKAQIGKTIYYDPSYQQISYPGGDVPLEGGVCTDVIIRAFRSVDVDFQKLVHQDMAQSFGSYPKNWGLKSTDSNIDHRRVPNLQTFFKRKGKSLSVTQNSSDYLPGDIVTWKLDSGLDHIGLVSDLKTSDQKRYLIIHNIGWGAQEEDILFEFTITGHYRFF